MIKFKLRGHSICLGDQEWPPALKDPAASLETLEMIVDALNYEPWRKEWLANRDPKNYDGA